MAIFTYHSKQRCRDRGITQEQATRVIDYGEKRPGRGDGLEFYIDIIRAQKLSESGHNVFDCVGISVVVASGDVVMTVYRNDEEVMQWRLQDERRAGHSRLKVSLGELIGELLAESE